jgi:tetratricopeptide (TPR) repeat protein
LRLAVAAALVASSLLVPATAAAADPTAEELYGRIEDRLARAETLEAPIARLMLLRSARDIQDDILDAHPDSAIAAELVLGNAITRRVDAALAEARDELDEERGSCDTTPTRSCVFARALDLREQLGAIDEPFGWFSDLAKATAAIGLLEIAFDYAEREPFGDLQDATRADLVIDLARHGRLPQARERAGTIWAGERVRVFAELAVEHYKSRDHRGAVKLLTQAADLAAEQRRPAHLLATVAAAWARIDLGGEEAPFTVLERAEGLAAEMGESWRSEALAHLAEAHARLGNGDDARRLLDALAEPDPLAAYEVHLTLAQHHAERGNTEAARSVYLKAHNSYENIDWNNNTDRWPYFVVRHIEVVRDLGYAGHDRKIADWAKDLLLEHDDPDAAVTYLIELARLLGERGDRTAAAAMIAAAEEVLARIDEPDRRHQHRGELIVVAAAVDETEVSRRLAAGAGEPLTTDVLMRQARAHAEAGDAAAAVATAASIDDARLHAQVLLRIVPALP